MVALALIATAPEPIMTRLVVIPGFLGRAGTLIGLLGDGMLSMPAATKVLLWISRAS